MGAIANSNAGDDDPFAGYAPQPVRCRWLSPVDEAKAPSAEIIRLIVDESRGMITPPWPNEIYNRHLIHEVVNFIGPTSAVMVTPAGIITTKMDWLDPVRASVPVALEIVRDCVRHADLGSPRMALLLGVDACVPGIAVPVQAVVHLGEERSVSLTNTAIKVYPSENGCLFGWHVCEAEGELIPELLQGHIANTHVGKVLVLVCHELVLFSGRSESNLTNSLGLAMRERYRQAATLNPPARYVVVPTHWQDERSGGSFINAAFELSKESGATVVLTMRAPKISLEAVANRFAVVGPNSDRVVTLLVEDTE